MASKLIVGFIAAWITVYLIAYIIFVNQDDGGANTDMTGYMGIRGKLMRVNRGIKSEFDAVRKSFDLGDSGTLGSAGM